MSKVQNQQSNLEKSKKKLYTLLKNEKKLSTFVGDSMYTRAPPTHRSPLRSNNYRLRIYHSSLIVSEICLANFGKAFSGSQVLHTIHLKLII